MSKKVMRLLNASGLMECKVCGVTHFANLKSYSRGTYYGRGSWQCPNGCKLEGKDNEH